MLTNLRWPATIAIPSFQGYDILGRRWLTGRSVMKRSELADLAAFVAVGELLSFRAAAARLGITRSALSHAMQQLEKRLDVRLLHRSTRHVALTDQGRRLFERLRAPFGGIHQALAELD